MSYDAKHALSRVRHTAGSRVKVQSIQSRHESVAARIQSLRPGHGLQPACLCGLYSSVYSSFSSTSIHLFIYGSVIDDEVACWCPYSHLSPLPWPLLLGLFYPLPLPFLESFQHSIIRSEYSFISLFSFLRALWCGFILVRLQAYASSTVIPDSTSPTPQRQLYGCHEILILS